jgi:hypothetical protein
VSIERGKEGLSSPSGALSRFVAAGSSPSGSAPTTCVSQNGERRRRRVRRGRGRELTISALGGFLLGLDSVRPAPLVVSPASLLGRRHGSPPRNETLATDPRSGRWSRAERRGITVTAGKQRSAPSLSGKDPC